MSKLKDKFGQNDLNAKKVAVIDYSGPNIASSLSAWDIFAPRSLDKHWSIFTKRRGTGVIKDNHLGDWGAQFGKLVYAYQEWGDKKKIAENPIKELNELYVKFHKEAEKIRRLKTKPRDI